MSSPSDLLGSVGTSIGSLFDYIKQLLNSFIDQISSGLLGNPLLSGGSGASSDSNLPPTDQQVDGGNPAVPSLYQTGYATQVQTRFSGWQS